MNPTPVRLALAAAALTFLAACGDADPAGTAPSQPPSSTSTPDRGTVGSTLKNAVTAQESYHVENQRYTTSVADLEAQGFVPGDVQVSVLSASATAYCMRGTLGTVNVYYDSEVGVPNTTPCT